MADDSGSAEGGEPAAPTRPGLPFNRQSLERFLMIFLFLLALYAIIDQQVGTSFATLAGSVLYPVFGFGGTLPVLTILLLGLATTTIGSVLRDHYTNWVKMARTQRVIRAWSRERMEAMRKGQQTRVQMLMEAQRGFAKDQMEMMTSPYKATAWTMFFFIVMIVWLRLFVDTVLLDHGNQWITVPWSTHVFLPLGVVIMPAWLLLYSLLAVPFGQIVTRILRYIRFRRRLQAMGVPLRAEPKEPA